MTKDILRRITFRPYLEGAGPTFRLVVWDTNRTAHGKSILGYCLKIREAGPTAGPAKVLFRGEDFGCSPCHSVDGDRMVAALMGFLTLRPGDTDREYFDGYTTRQMDYCSHHAEALSCEVTARFGED